MSERKTGLVVLYNHNYERNIENVRAVYHGRFSEMRQIMPFYYGSDPEVIRVFGHSFRFHSYIAQAREKLMQMDCDDFLIIGDDVLLNPAINEHNTLEMLHMEPGSFYMDVLVDIAQGRSTRAIKEVQNFSTKSPGLDASASRIMPSYEEAVSILSEKGVFTGTELAKYTPFYLPLLRPFLRNARKNLGHMKSNIVQLCMKYRYRLSPRKMAYPCVMGYSDLLVIPKGRMCELCNYLEVLDTWRVFVELAIPTAISLLKDAKIHVSDECELKSGNVFFPPGAKHHYEMLKVIDAFYAKLGGDMGRIPEEFPSKYLYLHPVKFSRFQ